MKYVYGDVSAAFSNIYHLEVFALFFRFWYSACNKNVHLVKVKFKKITLLEKALFEISTIPENKSS